MVSKKSTVHYNESNLISLNVAFEFADHAIGAYPEL